MVDRNLQNFYGRIGRIEDIHRAGGGFEADGTLGMSYYNARRRRPRRRIGILAPLVVVAMGIVGVKAMVHATVGAEVYEERLAELRDSEGVARTAAYVLEADPVTLILSAQLRGLLN